MGCTGVGQINELAHPTQLWHTATCGPSNQICGFQNHCGWGRVQAGTNQQSSINALDHQASAGINLTKDVMTFRLTLSGG